MKLLKNLKPLWLAILFIAVVEFIIFLIVGKEKINSSIIENTLFDNQFKKSDVPQKYLIKYKYELFSGDKSEFIQVGDSSGLYGVRPNIINNYLNGMKYTNTNCCADIGWKGYAITANYFLKNNKNAKFLVLYFSPYVLPSPLNQENELTNDIKGIYNDNLNSDFFRIFNYLPSQAIRKSVLKKVFLEEKNKSSSKNEFSRVLNDMGLLDYFEKYTGYKPSNLLEALKFHKGWMPLDRKKEVISGSCGVGIADRYFGKYKMGSLTKGIEMMNNVATKHSVDLIVIFNPVACKESEQIKPIIEELMQFKNKYPNIVFPNDFITTIDKKNFADNEHLNPQASIQNSQDIGEKIRYQILNNNNLKSLKQN